MKNVLKYIIVFIIMIIIFCTTLTLTSMIPKNLIEKKVVETSEILNKETNDFFIPIVTKNRYLRFDNYTDALMINTAYSINNKTPFYSAMVARKNFIVDKTEIIYPDTSGDLKSASNIEGYDPVGELNGTVNNNITESFEYARYWHGYLIILRPLLILFNITEIRKILLVLFAILGITILYKLYKKVNLSTSIIFLLGFIICDYFYIGFSLQGTSIFLIATIASIILLSKEIKDKSMFFMIIGGLTSFFDFLTVPIMTLGIPLLIYSLIKNKNNCNLKEIYLELFKCCIFWAIGYLGVWIVKWILVDVVYNKGLINSVIYQFRYRTENFGNIDYTLKDLLNTLMYIIKLPFGMGILITIILIIIKIVRIRNLSIINFNYKQISIYFCVGCLGVAWYIALKQHSFQHLFFTYRNTWLIYTSLLLIIYNLFSKNEKIETNKVMENEKNEK